MVGGGGLNINVNKVNHQCQDEQEQQPIDMAAPGSELGLPP